jgi:hypothetical protein
MALNPRRHPLNLIRVMPAKGRTVTHSKQLAGFIGPLLAAMGVAMLLNRELLPAMIGQLSQNYGLVLLSGALLLLAGIAIVRVHNIWAGGWPVVVTVLGWLAIVGGLVRMWFPQQAVPIAETFGAAPTAMLIAGLVIVATGGFLSFKAYGPDT